MADNFNKNRIVKNSVLLYVRMMFTMWINLYATRLVLQNLGVDDMGVYGVVGSIVGFFSVLTSGITNAIQRFITYELGRAQQNVNNVFCTSINVILLLTILLVILLESAGIWILNNKLNIPDASRDAAFWVYQLSILACVFNLVSVPYNALVIAHEKMDAFAVISILQVILTCCAAYCLSFFTDHRLIIYAAAVTLIGIMIRIVYQVYCHYKFKDIRYQMRLDLPLLKQISRYAGIATISGALEVVCSQGITFVINWTFGVAINAVYAISLQLKNSVLSFAFNLYKAISPQITKTYASGDLSTHKKLVYSSSKIETYMIYFIMIPFLFRTGYIMKLWLGNLPDYVVGFAQCTIFVSLLYAAFSPIHTAVLATAKISRFLIFPNIFALLVLPVSYVISKMTGNPLHMIICIVLFDILTNVLRLFFAAKVTVLNVSEMLCEVVLPSMLVALLSGGTCYLISLFTDESLVGLLLLLLLNSLALAGIILALGLSKGERRLVTSILAKVRLKKHNDTASEM